jgi:hypothetical protein
MKFLRADEQVRKKQRGAVARSVAGDGPVGLVSQKEDLQQ